MQSLTLTLFTVALFLSSTVLASPLSSYSLIHKRSGVPQGWSQVGKFHPYAILPLRFGLAQSNINNIEDLLLDVSDPESPNFGQHWSPSRVADTFKPSDDTIRTVRDWLIKSGIDPKRITLSHQRTWIELNATVEEAERLLQAQYNVYEHHTGAKHVACDAYHLPKHVIPHVDLVTPTIDFSRVLAKRAPSSDDSGIARKIGQPGFPTGPKKGPLLPNPLPQAATHCDTATTLDCLRALYGIVYNFVSPSKNTFGIVEYTPQAYLASDLDLFSSIYAPTLVGKRPELASVDGGVVQTSQTSFALNGESDLDLEYAMGLVGPTQPVKLYQVGDLVMGASFNNLLDALDGSYCTFEGGDDPNQDGVYPDTAPGGYNAGITPILVAALFSFSHWPPLPHVPTAERSDP